MCYLKPLELRQPLIHLFPLKVPFAECRFESLYDMLGRTAAKRFVFEALSFRLDVLGEAFAILPQACNFSFHIERGVIWNE